MSEVITGDVGHDPYFRIMQEKPVLEDSEFQMVVDRDPICERHILVMAKSFVPSIADSEAVAHLASVISSKKIRALTEGSWLYFERGRATFCTSGFTESQAHGHLVTREKFEAGCLNDLARELGSKRFSDLLSAYEYAGRETGEYLLFGSIEEGFWVSTNLKLPPDQKRYVRTFLRSRLIDC